MYGSGTETGGSGTGAGVACRNGWARDGITCPVQHSSVQLTDQQVSMLAS